MKLPTIEEREAHLENHRGLKMARSAHAYVRGNTARFYEWLAASSAASLVPEGPAIWICGDCHLGNLGPIANGEGHIEIQIRDLDQAVIGNPAHDLIRLGLSLATAARSSDLPGVTTARMIEAMVEGYGKALADPHEGDAGPEPDAVRTVRQRARVRRWKQLARERLEHVEPSIPLGKRFWPLSVEERVALAGVFADPAVTQMVCSLSEDPHQRDVHLADAAYWRKGCSSLGLLRYAAILKLEDKRESDYALVDVKEAVAAVAPVAPHREMPADPADRVVAAARALSPHLGERMAAAKIGDRSVFIRELMPQDLKIDAEQFSEAQAIRAAHHLAFVVGRAHARQMDEATRREWQAALQAGRSHSIDAPGWLWESVVSLAGSHERGYLEHCRRYALRDLAA